MAYEVLMPQLGLTMEEGTVSRWLRQEGEAVKTGEALLEITTDKLTNEVLSEHDGVLLKIVAQEGEDVPVKGLLAYIGQSGETVGGAPAAPAPTPAPAPAPAALELMEGDSVEKLTGMRKVVAERMSRSHSEIPSVTQTTKVDVTELMRLRRQLQQESGVKYSVNDLILKAVAKALRQHPEILVSYDGGRMVRRAHVNLGMAVALDAGLIVPVIRDADRLSLDALSAAARDLADRAKTNRLTADEYKGSTFTVSNLGMFGVESFTPIINQPDAGILGVCAVEDELVMDDQGTISKRQVMRVSFTFDHRLIDGAVAARFALDLRDLLQTPLRILL